MNEGYRTTKKMKTFRILFWLFPILILLLAVLPINGPDSYVNRNYVGEIRMDHLVHAIIFTCWILLFGLGFQSVERKITWTAIPYLLFFFGVACFTELIQVIIPGRRFSRLDLLANFAGVILGAALLLLQTFRLPNPFKSRRL
jgi:VanZ family protein